MRVLLIISPLNKTWDLNNRPGAGTLCAPIIPASLNIKPGKKAAKICPVTKNFVFAFLRTVFIGKGQNFRQTDFCINFAKKAFFPRNLLLDYAYRGNKRRQSVIKLS
ncbi:hypothetical protein DPQ22_01560 [Candidatus Tokpelaia sp.]|nr:hypothetical protein DPQ22_01560 [Candidatus Tokpelaia sp.]